MAKQHPSGVTGADAPADTDRHARTFHVGDLSDRRDELIVLGDAIYLSKHRCQEYQSSAYKTKVDKYYEMRIDQETILGWADEIRMHNKMASARQQTVRDGTNRHPDRCYEGTDTINPEKDKHSIRDKPNQFQLDRSESNIRIGSATGTRFLNGSAVEHSHWVHIDVEGPDGRTICEIGMSYDQFASALFSNMAQPCTMMAYWSVNDKNFLLQEVVKEPDSINDRMRQRLGGIIGDLKDLANSKLQALFEKYQSGKPLNKKEMEETINGVKTLINHLDVNTAFVVEQASEEAAKVVETAAIQIAMIAGISPEQMDGLSGQRYLSQILHNARRIDSTIVQPAPLPPPTGTQEQKGPPA